MGAGLWLLLLASLVLMGVFSHLAYGAGLASVLTGLATTLAILAAVLAVAYASTRDRGRSEALVHGRSHPAGSPARAKERS